MDADNRARKSGKKGDCRDKFFRKDPAETKRPVLLKLALARRQIETNHGLSDNPLIIAGGTRFDAASNGLKEQYFNINILYSAAYKWCVVRRVAANDFYLGFIWVLNGHLAQFYNTQKSLVYGTVSTRYKNHFETTLQLHTANDSRFLPLFSAATNQRGAMPRPVHALPSLSLYLTATFLRFLPIVFFAVAALPLIAARNSANEMSLALICLTMALMTLPRLRPTRFASANSFATSAAISFGDLIMTCDLSATVEIETAPILSH